MNLLIPYIGRKASHISICPSSQFISFLASTDSSTNKYQRILYSSSLLFISVIKMVSNTKTFQSKPRPERRGSSPKPPASRTDQEVTPNEHPTTDHRHHRHKLHTSHVLYMVPSGGSPASFTQPPSRICGCCSDFSIDVQPSQNRTSVLSQQSPSTEDLFILNSGSAQRASSPPNSTDQQRDEIHLPMTMDLYSPIGRWEAQTTAEDAWSTFVALENGAHEPIGKKVDIMRELVIGDFFSNVTERKTSLLVAFGCSR